MKKITYRLIAIIAVLMLLTGLVACGKNKPVNPDDSTDVVVKVGFVYPKTGVLASFGEYTEEWTKYVIDQINQKGLTIDGKTAQISLITADSQSDPEVARQAAKKLIDDKNIDIMITSKTADTTVPVSEICERKGVVCLSVDTPDDIRSMPDLIFLPN